MQRTGRDRGGRWSEGLSFGSPGSRVGDAGSPEANGSGDAEGRAGRRSRPDASGASGEDARDSGHEMGVSQGTDVMVLLVAA